MAREDSKSVQYRSTEHLFEVLSFEHAEQTQEDGDRPSHHRGRHLMQVISVGRESSKSHPTYQLSDLDRCRLSVLTIMQFYGVALDVSPHIDKCQIPSFVLPASAHFPYEVRRPIRQREIDESFTSPYRLPPCHETAFFSIHCLQPQLLAPAIAANPPPCHSFFAISYFLKSIWPEHPPAQH